MYAEYTNGGRSQGNRLMYVISGRQAALVSSNTFRVSRCEGGKAIPVLVAWCMEGRWE